MKKSILFISIFALFLAACTSRTADNTQAKAVVAYEDTVGLSAFQDWKFQNELKQASDYGFKEETPVVAKKAPAKKKAVVRKKAQPAVNTNTNNTGVNDNGTGSTETVGTETTNTGEQEEEKKGISKAAKGTAIGAASGAVLGAVIHKKNRVMGGVIGGVLGGAIGYGIGRKMDKKDGR